MKTVKLRAEDDFIKLGQALKKAGMEDSGVDAKYDIQNGLVKVIGETDTRRGRKLVEGDVVEYNGEQVKIEK